MSSSSPHPPHRRASGHHAGLDGLRALSISAVLLYHGGVAWAGGGFLGVEVFFVLSGFLITSLLVGEWRRRSAIALLTFWGRRARRLLPALFCLVAVIGIYYAATAPGAVVPGLKGDGLATLLYVGNWHQLAAGTNYFAANGPISPLEHTWSLAIEEQFYLVWPLIVAAVLWCGRRAGLSPVKALGTLLGVGALGIVLSAGDSLLRVRTRGGVDRVYYGTDTRAAALLVGASFAIALAIIRASERGPGRTARPGVAGGTAARRLTAVAPALALVAILATMRLAGSGSLWLYPFGLLAVDAAVVVVIGAVVLAPRTPVARLLSLSPLPGIGKISYGIYLWHFPLFLWLDSSTTGVGGTALFALRIAVTLAVSLISYHVIERPIREGWLPPWVLRPLAPVAAAGAAAALLLAASVESTALGSAAVPPPAPTDAWVAGTDRPCPIQLTDTAQYGLAPLSAALAARDEPAWLVEHRLRWDRSSRVTFTTCPPKRVLLIGDSLAFTLGVGLMENEQRYGVEVANAAILGCAFNNRGELESRGKWEQQYRGCPGALQQWAADERALHAQAVVVELGYRDEFNWRVNGQAEHIGQPAYDRWLRQRIAQYVQVLGQGGVPLLFLTVPWSDPAPLPDGSPAPAASPARHRSINAALAAAAAADPGQVRILDTDRVISPGNHYDVRVDGQLCRFDGVHLTVFCSRLLQQDVLTSVRSMIHG